MRPIIYSYQQPEKERAFIKKLRELMEFNFYINISKRVKDDTDTEESLVIPLYKLMTGDFDAVDWNSILPLEAEILTQMAPYEYQALQMCSRMVTGNHDSVNEQKDYYLQQVRFAYHILTKHKIDFYIQMIIPHSACDFIMYCLCKILQIPTLLVWFMPILKDGVWFSYTASSIETQMAEAGALFKRLKEAGTKVDASQLLPVVKRYLNAYNADITTTVKGEEAFDLKEVIKTRTGLVFNNLRKLSFKYLYKKTAMTLKKDAAMCKGRQYYQQNCIKPDFSQGEKYVVLALHFQPEATTLPLGGWYMEQLLVAQMLSYHMKDGVYLYVKEHPAINYYRDKEYYECLTKMHNVRLIDKSVNTLALIRNSSAVATVTGTVGWESLFNRKPVLMFGEFFYKYAPGVFSIRSNEDCRKALDIVSDGNYMMPLDDLMLFLYCMQDFIMDDPLVVDEDGEFQLHQVYKQKLMDLYQ